MTDLGRRIAKLGEYAGQDDEELEQEPAKDEPAPADDEEEE